MILSYLSITMKTTSATDFSVTDIPIQANFSGFLQQSTRRLNRGLDRLGTGEERVRLIFIVTDAPLTCLDVVQIQQTWQTSPEERTTRKMVRKN